MSDGRLPTLLQRGVGPWDVAMMKTGDPAEPRQEVGSSIFPPGNRPWKQSERSSLEEALVLAHHGEPCTPLDRVAFDLEGVP